MMISYNTLLQQSLSRGLQSPHYIPPGQKINTDQLNNVCLAIMINYNTLINYEKTNLPVDRHVRVTLQNPPKKEKKEVKTPKTIGDQITSRISMYINSKGDMVKPCCVHRRKKKLLNRWWKALVCVAGAVGSCITAWKPFIINNKLQTINGRSGQTTVIHYATLNKNRNFSCFFFWIPIYI